MTKEELNDDTKHTIKGLRPLELTEWIAMCIAEGKTLDTYIKEFMRKKVKEHKESLN